MLQGAKQLYQLEILPAGSPPSAPSGSGARAAAPRGDLG